MKQEPGPEDLLRMLELCQQDADRLQAGISAAHIDAAISALCTQFELSRNWLPGATRN